MTLSKILVESGKKTTKKEKCTRHSVVELGVKIICLRLAEMNWHYSSYSFVRTLVGVPNELLRITTMAACLLPWLLKSSKDSSLVPII